MASFHRALEPILRGISEAPAAAKEWKENGLKRLSATCIRNNNFWVVAGCAVVSGAVAGVGVRASWDFLTSGAQQQAIQSNLTKPAADQESVSSNDFTVVTNAIKAMRGEEFGQSCQ
jgi:hypothetical protein